MKLPGIYQQIPEAEYHRLPGLSWHRIAPALDSPIEARWQAEHPHDDAGRRYGRLVHCAALTPHLIDAALARGEVVPGIVTREEAVVDVRRRGRCPWTS